MYGSIIPDYTAQRRACQSIASCAATDQAVPHSRAPHGSASAPAGWLLRHSPADPRALIRQSFPRFYRSRTEVQFWVVHWPLVSVVRDLLTGRESKVLCDRPSSFSWFLSPSSPLAERPSLRTARDPLRRAGIARRGLTAPERRSSPHAGRGNRECPAPPEEPCSPFGPRVELALSLLCSGLPHQAGQFPCRQRLLRLKASFHAAWKPEAFSPGQTRVGQVTPPVSISPVDRMSIVAPAPACPANIGRGTAPAVGPTPAPNAVPSTPPAATPSAKP